MRPLLLFVLLAIVLPPRVALSEPTAPHADHDHAAMVANEALPAASATPDPHAGHDHAAINAAPELPAKLAELSTAERAPQPGQSLYVCPMHPNIVRTEPGNCPLCGMALEPLKPSGPLGSVEVSPALSQSLGLTTATAAPSKLWRYIETLGEVRWDERKLVHIHSRASGWLERLVARNSGDFVKQGELLYEIYAPDLVAAQNDFLNALNVIKRDSAARSLYQRARLRLELLGMTSSQIDRLEKSGETFYRLPVYAPASGYITELAVRQGMYVMPEMTLMQLADRSSVFLVAQVFGDQIPWLRPGMPVEIDLAEAGVFKREATIDLLYPELDAVTRAQQVRIVLANSDGLLRAGMLAQVRLYGGAREVAVAIPRQALISSGNDNRVVVQAADQRFVVMPVQIGMVSREQVEIVQGLAAGDQVVTSGQFLLDAEAQLQAAAARMAGAPAANPHANH